MIRKLTTLGLALVGVLALTAVAAATASAAEEEFHCAKATCVITATTETEPEIGPKHDRFVPEEAEPTPAECHGHFEGTQEFVGGVADKLTLVPTYTSCTDTPERVVRTNHCAYIFTSNTTPGTTDAPVKIECAEGSKIELDIKGVCTLTFGEQTPKGGVHYTNTGSSTITVQATIEEIEYKKSNQTGSQFFCGLIQAEKGEYEAVVTAHCYEDTEENPGTTTATEKTTPTRSTDSGTLVNCRWE